MGFAPIDPNSIQMDAAPSNFAPVDPASIQMDAPTTAQQADASTTGRFINGAVGQAMGIAEAVPHAISYATSLGGNYPNSVSNFYDKSAKQQDSMEQTRAKYLKDAEAATGFSGPDIAGTAGAILSPANAIVGTGAAMLPVRAGLMAKALQGTMVGGAYGAVQPADDPTKTYAEQETANIGTGALTGGALSAGTSALANVIKPEVSQGAQTLLDSGVRLTPGQILGGTSQRIEDALTSVPMLGDAINSAKLRGITDMNKAVANRALAPIGEKLPDNVNAGHDMVSYVQEKLSNAYNTIIPKLTGQADGQFNSEISNLRSMAQNMPAPQANQFNNILDTQVMSKIGVNGSISGQSLKEMESSLGNYAKGYTGDSNFDQRNLGNAVSEVQNSVRGMLQRSNPTLAPELQNINEGYANYARLRAAAASTGAGKNEGIFTPAQLANAVRNGDKSVGKGQFSQGNALLQDLSGPANNVLPSTVPDSGSIGRALVAGGVLGHFSPAAAVGAAGASSIYTTPGIAMARALLTSRPDAAQPVATALRKVASPADLARALFAQ